VSIVPSDVSIAPSDVSISPSDVSISPSDVIVAPSDVIIAPSDVMTLFVYKLVHSQERILQKESTFNSQPQRNPNTKKS